MIDHLVFTISDKLFAISADRVSEVERLKDIRIDPIPGVPDHILGIINLRGDVIPVMCGRIRLGMVDGHGEQKMRLLILMTDTYRFGFLVDRIIGTHHLDDAFTSNVQKEWNRFKLPILGTYQNEDVMDGRMIAVVDTDMLAMPSEGQVSP